MISLLIANVIDKVRESFLSFAELLFWTCEIIEVTIEDHSTSLHLQLLTSGFLMFCLGNFYWYTDHEDQHGSINSSSLLLKLFYSFLSTPKSYNKSIAEISSIILDENIYKKEKQRQRLSLSSPPVQLIGTSLLPPSASTQHANI